MDEILIEEKKYVSSKRAAKITGYAKDYIGQLCREGRVPARLVGRSWYVLESAIQDHRFGDEQKESQEETLTSLSGTWENPRYEAATFESIPPVNRVTDPANAEKGESTEIMESVADETNKLENDSIQETGEIPVPLHTEQSIHAREVTERAETPITSDEDDMPSRTVAGTVHTDKIRTSYAAPILLGVLTAFLLAVLAIVNTGYLDSYFIEHGALHQVAGIIMYNK